VRLVGEETHAPQAGGGDTGDSAADRGAPGESLRVLVVCTANVCRSPMGEALLRARAQVTGLPVAVASAGTRAARLPVDPEAVRAVAALGVHIGEHTPRQVSRDLVATDGADLVLTMTRAHLRDVAVMGSGVFPRTFTLREAVRRLETVRLGARPEAAGPVEAARALIGRAGEGRRPSELMGDHPGDDIADPYGAGAAAVAAAAVEIDHLVARIVARLTSP
jgi:protein-tyrosine phosphatase